MNTISKKTNITSVPNKELLESIQEIENYKNGKIELDSYDDVKALRKTLTANKDNYATDSHSELFK